MSELNEKTQYKFQSYDDLPEPETLSDKKIARIVFDALFKEPPDYMGESDRDLSA